MTLLYNPVPGSSRQSRPHTLRCVRVAAGGANTFFVVDKLDRASQHEVTELYSAGMGQYGQLGNSQWTHMQGVPVRVHAVSELMECESSGYLCGEGLLGCREINYVCVVSFFNGHTNLYQCR